MTSTTQTPAPSPAAPAPVPYASPSRRRKSAPRFNYRLLLFLAVLTIPVGAILYMYLDSALSGGIKNHGAYSEVDLKAMSDFPLDQINGTVNEIPPRWRALDGKRVLLQGEMYQPFSGSDKPVEKFDLVYSIAKCCVTSSPLVQHFVKSTVEGNHTVDYYSGQQVKVMGTLHVDLQREQGKVTQVYRLDVESVEPV